MLTNFHNSVANKFSSKFLKNSYISHAPHLKCVTSLFVKFVLKNSNVPELSEANCHAALNELQKLMKIFTQ